MKRYIRSADSVYKSEDDFLDAVGSAANVQLPKSHAVRFIFSMYVSNAAVSKNYADNVCKELLSRFYDSNDVAGAASYLVDCIQEGQRTNQIVFKENCSKFLEQYRSYYEQIADAVDLVASKNNSDMFYDIDDVIAGGVFDKVENSVNWILNYDSISISDYDFSIGYALGMKAVYTYAEGRNHGVPKYYVQGDETIQGPNGIYYQGNPFSLELSNFESELGKITSAVQTYFDELAHYAAGGDYQSWRASQEPTSSPSTSNKPKRTSKWLKMISNLESDLDSGIRDPLYDETSAGAYLLALCNDVEKSMNLYVEPSVQGGTGGVWIYDSANNDEILVQGYDFELFDSNIIDIALASKNMTEFKRRYQNYLQNIISDD